MKTDNDLPLRPLCALLLVAALIVSLPPPPARPADTLPPQTNVALARRVYDENGILTLDIEGIGAVYNPAFIALDALQAAGLDMYHGASPTKPAPDLDRFRKAVSWLASNLVQTPSGLHLWQYPFDNTYNDATIRAPWASAFGQAVGIEALLASHRLDNRSDHLALAENAAAALFVPVADGGLLFSHGADVWFEEYPDSPGNPTHILNGHMRALIALKQLQEATGKTVYADWFDTGCDTLLRWLPLFDNTSSLRYDLNPRKSNIQFRLANPYGFPCPPLAVDRINIRDPLTGRELSVDVAAKGDFEGPCRLSGNLWGQPTSLDGRTVRRLASLIPPPAETSPEPSSAPYFYLSLPADWTDNLRAEPFQIEIVYKDEVPANIAVQLRPTDPSGQFVNLRDGDLLLSGSGKWRSWKIPLRPSDLGFPVGGLYPAIHESYLAYLARYRPALVPWAETARLYHALAQDLDLDSVELVDVLPLKLPRQTPLLPIYSLDENDVVMQHYPTDETIFFPKGTYDPSGDRGFPIYHFFVVASQLIDGPDIAGGIYSQIDRGSVRREPALRWLLDPANFSTVKDTAVYHFDFVNCYNDIVSPKPWQSAFGQPYVAKALLYAIDNDLASREEILPHLQKVVNAYALPVDEGGLATRSKSAHLFVEEVPQKSHVLNAHLVSATSIADVLDLLDNPANRTLYDELLGSLRHYLHIFDNGYWSRYDQNPRKEIICQIDWLGGSRSPLIDDIWVVNPLTNHATTVDVGSPGDFQSYPRISGTDWTVAKTLDGRTVRGFHNGYTLRDEPSPGGARHNVFFLAVLPGRTFRDYFDVPPLTIALRYLDLAKGSFVLKVQTNNEGSRIQFAPLHNALLKCTGDGAWKTATFTLRPNDMGWYLGPAYQVYHVDQLSALARQTGDWFFSQYAEKWRYYLTAKTDDADVLHAQSLADFAPLATIVASSSTYENHSVENALDSDPFDDYVAAVETPLPHSFQIDLTRAVTPRWIELIWESDANYASAYTVEAVSPAGDATLVASVENAAGMHHLLPVKSRTPLRHLRVTVTETVGQPRLMLRQIKVVAPVPAGMPPLPFDDMVDLAPSASVVASPPMYKNHKIENALDSDPSDDYAAAKKSPLPHRLTLEFPWPVEVAAVDLFWESDDNCASDYSLSAADGVSLADVTSASGMFQRVVLPAPAKTNRLTLSVSRFTGSPRLMLRQIKVLASPHSPLISGKDPANPLHIFSLAVPAALERIRRNILAGRSGLSPQDKINAFMDYLCTMKIAHPSKLDLLTPLAEGRGSCGSFANTLLAFCSLEGIKGRSISLLNYPKNNGHSVVELLVDGKWRLYDPTFGIYYVAESVDGTRDVLSFDDLRNGAAGLPGVTLARSPGARRPETISPGQRMFFSSGIYTDAQPAGVIGPAHPMTFPLELDPHEKPFIGLKDFGPTHQGAWMIGGACLNVSQEFTLKGLTPGRSYSLEIQYTAVCGDLAGKKEFHAAASLESGGPLDSGERYTFTLSRPNDPWLVSFRARSDKAVLLLTHDYLEHFYLLADSYRLRELE